MPAPSNKLTNSMANSASGGVPWAAARRQLCSSISRWVIAYAITQRDIDEHNCLRAAAQGTPPDAEFAIELVSLLDGAGMYSDADVFIQRAARLLNDLAVQRLLAQTLWEDADAHGLVDRLKGQDPSNPKSDGTLLGYRALALYHIGNTSDGKRLVEALAVRSDAASAAWAMALQAIYASPPLPSVQLVSRLREAVLRQPANPVLHLFYGQGLMHGGESELALEQFSQASQLAPRWATPYVQRALALAAGARPAEALAAARQAVARAPGRRDTQTALALAAYASVARDGGSAQYAKLLPMLAELHKAGEQSTLPVYVSVLSQLGKREEAMSAVKAALEREPAPPTDILLRLAEVCDERKLGLGESVRAAAQRIAGLTPEIALAQSRALLQEGKPADGLQLMLAAARGRDSDIAWRLAAAQYREAARDPDALKEWIALGEQFPNDALVQEAILRAPSLARDRTFWSRTIDRLKAAGGEEALTWRIARGLWLLSGPANDRDSAKAVNLLTQVTHAAPALVEPHRLLALAMERLKNNAGAITELTAASEARPGDPAITAELVRLLIASQRNSDALFYLDKLARNPALTSDARHAVAATYIEQGYDDKAISLLSSEKTQGAAAVERDWMLARLYRRGAKPDAAAALYKSLLDTRAADPRMWADGADFFASRKDMGTAQMFLAKLAQIPMKPGALDLLRGRFAERWTSHLDAANHYQAATRQAPREEGAWTALAGFHLRRGQFTEAAADAAAGLVELPSSKALRALQSEVGTLATLENSPDFQPLADLISHNPLHAGGAEMLAAVAEAQSQKLPAQALAAKAGAVAEKYPNDLAIQTQAADLFILSGQYGPAAAIARRAAQSSPASPEPHQLLTGIYLNSGEWSKAEEEALLWRQRAVERPYAPDLALARIFLKEPKRQPAGALRLLLPYVSGPDAAQSRRPAVELYARALIMEGRSADAAELLKPLALKSREWRIAWLELASEQKAYDDASAWINQLVALSPPESGPERYQLANAWYNVGVQFGAAKALESARPLVDALLKASDCPPETWLLKALVSQAQGDFLAAEKAYRQVLATNPKSADAENDLAYLLWLKGRAEDLPEARKRAELAVAARPDVASYYDTLARIQARSGDHAAAADNFRTALTKDPNSLEAMIGLADLLSKDPKGREQAKDLFERIQRLVQSNPPLSPALRQQFQVVRDALAGTF